MHDLLKRIDMPNPRDEESDSEAESRVACKDMDYLFTICIGISPQTVCSRNSLQVLVCLRVDNAPEHEHIARACTYRRVWLQRREPSNARFRMAACASIAGCAKTKLRRFGSHVSIIKRIPEIRATDMADQLPESLHTNLPRNRCNAHDSCEAEHDDAHRAGNVPGKDGVGT